jgi:hypothetical protein
MSNINILKKEAIIITRYLINKKPSERAIDLYIEAHKKLPIELRRKEQNHWNIALRFPFLLQFIDAGYAFQKNTFGLRKKILLAFAILESLPEYSSHFLPQKRKNNILILFLIAAKSVVRTSIGILLLWIL